eukprot:3851303-Pleurochrysis_carterae.AAC.1
MATLHAANDLTVGHNTSADAADAAYATTSTNSTACAAPTNAYSTDGAAFATEQSSRSSTSTSYSSCRGSAATPDDSTTTAASTAAAPAATASNGAHAATVAARLRRHFWRFRLCVVLFGVGAHAETNELARIAPSLREAVAACDQVARLADDAEPRLHSAEATLVERSDHSGAPERQRTTALRGRAVERKLDQFALLNLRHSGQKDWACALRPCLVRSA